MGRKGLSQFLPDFNDFSAASVKRKSVGLKRGLAGVLFDRDVKLMVAGLQSDLRVALRVVDYDLVLLHIDGDGGVIDLDDNLSLVRGDSDELSAKQQEDHEREDKADAYDDTRLFPQFATCPRNRR